MSGNYNPRSASYTKKQLANSASEFRLKASMATCDKRKPPALSELYYFAESVSLIYGANKAAARWISFSASRRSEASPSALQKHQKRPYINKEQPKIVSTL